MKLKNKQDDVVLSSVEKTLNRIMGHSPTLSTQRRQRIWHKAQAPTNVVAFPPSFRWSRTLFYPIFVVILAFGFFSGYVGVVFASGASVPGELLYPIERGAEIVWLSLTPSSKRCDVELVLLERRVYEAKALIDAGKPVPSSVLQEIELLFIDLGENAECVQNNASDILPRLLLYRYKIYTLLLEHPGVWELHAVLEAANAAVTAFGGEPLEALPWRYNFG